MVNAGTVTPELLLISSSAPGLSEIPKMVYCIDFACKPAFLHRPLTPFTPCFLFKASQGNVLSKTAPPVKYTEVFENGNTSAYK